MVLGDPRGDLPAAAREVREVAARLRTVPRVPFPYVVGLMGEQRIPAKEPSKFFILEVRPLSEVDLFMGPSGLQLAENPCKPGRCDPPVPPWLYTGAVMYLVRDENREALDRAAAALKGKL